MAKSLKKKRKPLTPLKTFDWDAQVEEIKKSRYVHPDTAEIEYQRNGRPKLFKIKLKSFLSQDMTNIKYLSLKRDEYLYVEEGWLVLDFEKRKPLHKGLKLPDSHINVFQGKNTKGRPCLHAWRTPFLEPWRQRDLIQIFTAALLFLGSANIASPTIVRDKMNIVKVTKKQFKEEQLLKGLQ